MWSQSGLPTLEVTNKRDTSTGAFRPTLDGRSHRPVNSYLHGTANSSFLKAVFATPSTFGFTFYCNYMFTALHFIGMIVLRLFATQQFAACTLVS